LARTPEDVAEIVTGIAAKIPYRQIASKIGCSAATVCCTAKKPEVKELIEQAQKRLLSETLETATCNIIGLVNDYDKPPVSPENEDKEVVDYNKQRKDHGFRATIKILESAGMLPSHAPSLHVQNIYNQTTIQLTPLVQGILDKFAGSIQEPPDVVDVDWDEP